MKREKNQLGRILEATGHSINGLKACWQNEAAFRQNAALAFSLFIASFFVAKSPDQWLILVLPLVLLLVIELINSAIETTVDRIGTERHDLSGRAKDMGSAAVFLCLVLVGLCWVVVCWENFPP